MLSRDWPKPRLTPNPECQGCGRSIVTRFGGEAGGFCARCEDGMVRAELAVAWNEPAPALGQEHAPKEAP